MKRFDADKYPGVQIHESCYIDEPCSIGKRCNLGQNVVVSPDVTLGDNVKVQNNVSIYTGVVLEDDVFCGPSMVFTNIINPRSEIVRRGHYAKTIVRRGASMGANCTIVCGTEIGAYALVAAGAVVTKNVPAYALMVGVPARRIGWACRCGTPLPRGTVNGSLICTDCGNEYRASHDQLQLIKELQNHG